MSVKARIAAIQKLKPGEVVGYGMRYTAPSERRIAVLPIGYGDGFPRVRNQGGALIHGRRAPLIGGIAMDALMVDITDIPEAQMWDEAVIMGRQGGEEITVHDMAKLKNSVSYDVLTNWRLRLRRKSVNGEQASRMAHRDEFERCESVIRANMKLLFSEQNSDYEHYQFPYAIWAVPEAGETPSDIFNAGFLPSSRNLDRFYLCRQVRVNLAKFKPSSENRRILRKGAGIEVKLVPRDKFDYTPERRQFFKTYADIKFGKDVMTFERLDALFGSPIISHLLVFTDAKTGDEVGVATLYLEGKALAYYYYAFYDLNYYARNLGMFMMTSAVALFAERGFKHLYLGTCYSQTALYKTQFAGAEFFNGFRWSDDLDELKFIIRRDKKELDQHLLETEEYRDEFYDGDLGKISRRQRVPDQNQMRTSRD